MIVRRIARPLLATAFVAQGLETLSGIEQDAPDVIPTLKAMQNLPDPIAKNLPTDAELVTRVNGAVQVAGGILLATGRMPRVAAALLAATVIPANFGKHMFWAETDPLRKAQKRHAFVTDLSLVGGLILASVDTAGKPSLGWRGRRAGHRAAETLLGALPSTESTAQHDVAEKLGHAVQIGLDRGRNLAEIALEKTKPPSKRALPWPNRPITEARRPRRPPVRSPRLPARRAENA
jgi:uncharacterized membrane protein YphA (DoxX/SURF4 family)